MAGNRHLDAMRAMLGIPETIGTFAVNLFDDLSATGNQVLANPNEWARALYAGTQGDHSLSEAWNQKRDERRGQPIEVSPQTQAMQTAALGGINSVLQAGVEYLNADASLNTWAARNPNASETLGDYATSPTMEMFGRTAEVAAPAAVFAGNRLSRYIAKDVADKAATGTLGEALFETLAPKGLPAGGQTGIFAGRQALTNLAESGKTVRTSHGVLGAEDLYANQARAKKMTAAGVGAAAVWAETGWFQGADDMWRFEIDDSTARTRGPDEPKVNRSRAWVSEDVLEHPDQYGAYPQTAGIMNQTYDTRGGGSYDQPQNRIINNNARDRHNNSPDVEDHFRSTQLHEQQHAIQSAEGMNRGANPRMLSMQVPDTFLRGLDDWNGIMIQAGYNPDELITKPGLIGYDEPDSLAMDLEMQGGWLMDQTGMSEGQVEAMQDRLFGGNLRMTATSSDTLYHRSAGEVEARNVQARRDLTPQERAEIPPIETESVPRRDQWVDLKGGGTPQADGTVLPFVRPDWRDDIDKLARQAEKAGDRNAAGAIDEISIGDFDTETIRIKLIDDLQEQVEYGEITEAQGLESLARFDRAHDRYVEMDTTDGRAIPGPQSVPETGTRPRKDVVRDAKNLGLPATGKTADIERRVTIATKDPTTWTEGEFDEIKHHLSIHQDVRGGDNSASIMKQGMTSGMVDSLGDMDVGDRWTWGRGLTGDDAYLFRGGDMKFFKDTPYLDEGSTPFFHLKPTKPGQDIYEAITGRPRGGGTPQSLGQALEETLGGGVRHATVMGKPPPQVGGPTGGTGSRTAPAPDRDAVWKSQQDTARRIRGQRNKRTGAYAGGPPHINTPQKKAGLVTTYANRIERAIENGLYPGYFYDEGRRAIKEISEPGQEVINAQATGVTSSQVGPRDNMNYFMKGAEQRAMQGPQAVSTTIYPNKSQSEFLNTLGMGKDTPWLGHKRERYSNLLIPDAAVPGDMPQGSMMAPNDRWEGRGAGFKGPPSGELQVAWNDEIRELAMDRVNARRAARGERPLTVGEAQELHWAQIRADYEGRTPEIRPEDTIGGSLDRLTYQHSWESMPGKTAGHMPEVGEHAPGGISPGRYHQEMKPLVIGDDGKDRLVRGMGSDYQRPAFDAPGEFQGQYSPSTQSQSLVSQTDSGGLLPQSRARIEGTEAVRSFIYAQDADAGSVFSPVRKPGAKFNAVSYPTGEGPVNLRTLKAVQKSIRAQFGLKAAEDIVVVPSATGVKVFHPDGDKKFMTGMDAVNDRVREITGIDGVKGLSESHYNELNWKEGTATRDMLKILDNPDAELLIKHANSRQMRQLMGSFADKYEELQKAGFKPNQKLIDVLKTWRDQGLAGVRSMVKAGTAPAAALTILAAQDGPGTTDRR